MADPLRMSYLTRTLSWAIFACASAYAVSLSVFALTYPGWKPHRVETAWFVFAFVFLVALTGVVRPTTCESTGPTTAGFRSWCTALVLALTVIAYGASLTVGFLSDDFVLLELRDVGEGWRQGTSQFVRILPVALLQTVDAYGRGWGSVMAHAASLALHLTNGAILFMIARRLQLSTVASTFAMALFLLWPGSPEAVVWVSGVQDVLMTTASLSLVHAALDGRHPLILLGWVVVGLLSKETAVAMPILGAAALWCRGTRPPLRVVWTIVVCAVVVVAFSVWRVQVGGGAFAAAPTRFLIKEILAGAFGTLVFPWTSAELRQGSVFGFLMVAVVVAAAWTIVWPGRWSAVPRVVALGLLWVMLAVAPVYSLFFVSNTLEGSRYLYLPSAGWALVLAAPATLASRPAAVYRWMAGVVVALWGFTTYGHVLTWRLASAERDLIVAAAREIRAPECPGVTFVGATDNVRGAYVFRNGLEPALRRAGVPLAEDVAEPTTCVFTWTGNGFTRTR